jgi:hypothetical protein
VPDELYKINNKIKENMANKFGFINFNKNIRVRNQTFKKNEIIKNQINEISESTGNWLNWTQE